MSTTNVGACSLCGIYTGNIQPHRTGGAMCGDCASVSDAYSDLIGDALRAMLTDEMHAEAALAGCQILHSKALPALWVGALEPFRGYRVVARKTWNGLRWVPTDESGPFTDPLTLEEALREAYRKVRGNYFREQW